MLHQLLSLCDMRHSAHGESKIAQPTPTTSVFPQRTQARNSGVRPHISEWVRRGTPRPLSWRGARLAHSGHQAHWLHWWLRLSHLQRDKPSGNLKIWSLNPSNIIYMEREQFSDIWVSRYLIYIHLTIIVCVPTQHNVLDIFLALVLFTVHFANKIHSFQCYPTSFSQLTMDEYIWGIC